MANEQQAPKAKRKGLFSLGFFVKAAVALLVTVVTLWWSAKGANLGEVFDKLGRISGSLLVVYLATLITIHALRILRWGIVMKPLGNPSARAIFASACAGIPAAFFLPLRLGEFVRPAMISRAGVPFAGAMANVVFERVADGLMCLLLFFLLLRFLPASAPIPDELRQGANIALVAFGGAMIVLIVAFFARGPVIAIINKSIGLVSTGLAEKVINLMTTFLDGLKSLGSIPRFVAFVFLTAAYWGLNGAATYMLAANYFPQLPFMAGSFVISVVALAVAIPAGPGFIGPMQAGFKFGLLPFGLSGADTLVVSSAVHAVQIVLFAIFLGIGFLTAPGKPEAEAEAVAG